MSWPLPALLLTAGLGTRLDPLTRVRAKPAVPVAGEPLVRRIVRQLVADGITDIVCNLHHRPETLTAVLGDGSDCGARVRYSWEQPQVLGSAGGPRQALDIVGAGRFLVINGDTLTDANPRAIANAHAGTGAKVTLALVRNHDPQRYGGVRLDAEQRVTGFVRRGTAADGSYHFIGIQAVESSVFTGIPAGAAVSSIGDVYDRLLAAEPGSIRGVVLNAAFFDIGTVGDYRRTSAALLAGAADRGVRCHIATSAQLNDCIVWDDVSVGKDAILDRCILTDGAQVPPGSRFNSAVLLRDERGHLSAVPYHD